MGSLLRGSLGGLSGGSLSRGLCPGESLSEGPPTRPPPTPWYGEYRYTSYRNVTFKVKKDQKKLI